MLRKNGRLLPVSWKEALSYINSELALRKGVSIGRIGPFVDNESVVKMKLLINSLGSPHLYLDHFHPFNIDFRSNYLLPHLDSFDSIDFLLLINTNPRYEGSLLNLKIRQKVLSKSMRVAYIGSPLDLTFSCSHLGNNPYTLFLVAQGKHFSLLDLISAHNPSFLLGLGAHNRQDTPCIRSLVHNIESYYFRVRNAFLSSRSLHRISSSFFSSPLTPPSSSLVHFLHP